MIDLEAIRARAKKLCGMDAVEDVIAVQRDIDALLTEVERRDDSWRELIRACPTSVDEFDTAADLADRIIMERVELRVRLLYALQAIVNGL